MQDDHTGTDPERPRPGRSFQGPAHPADSRPVSAIARRVGPPLAAVALLVMVALLAWVGFAPTAIAGPIVDAPFALPATLVTAPDDDGCLRLVAGDGSVREHCLDELAGLDDEFGPIEARFDEQGRLVAGMWPDLLLLDPDTGEVLGTIDARDASQEPFEEPVREPAEGEGLEPRPRGLDVVVDGDRVRRYDPVGDRDEEDGEVVLDVDGPPGYRLGDAVLSPDGAWVVARTPRGEVIAAPSDMSAPPYVWMELERDRWVDLWQGIRWE